MIASSVFELDCCNRPDHVMYFIDRGEPFAPVYSHYWRCRHCSTWWTPEEYHRAALHDEQLSKQEREYYTYGKDEGISDTDLAPSEVYP